MVRLALKAQREPDVLAFLRERCPWVGLDVCSPGEAAWGLRYGWRTGEISYTGTNLSERDLDAILLRKVAEPSSNLAAESSTPSLSCEQALTLAIWLKNPCLRSAPAQQRE